MACQTSNDMSNSDDAQAPVAKKVPFEMTLHGDTRVDNYFWMRLSDAQKEAETPDAQTQEVLDFLEAENAYIDGKLAHRSPAADPVRRDCRPDQEGRPERSGPEPRIRYYTRYEEGKGYAISCRKKAGGGNPLREAPAKGGHARPEPACGRARLLRRRWHGRERRQPLAGLRRRHRQPPSVHRAFQGPDHGRNARR